jgi:hypothetical protein
MERMAGGSGSSGEMPSSPGGATGATSTGRQDTGAYQQPGQYEQGQYPQQPGQYQQQGPYQQPGQYQQGQYQQGTYQQPGQYQQAPAPYAQGGAPAEYRQSAYSRPEPSNHGAGLAILAGALAFLEGLAFVIRSNYFHTATSGYAYRWYLHGWGWVLLVLGAILIAGGVSHLLGIKGSGKVTAVVAILTAVVAFITLFYSVVWGIVVIAVSAWAAHNLLSHRDTEERYPAGTSDMGYGAQGQGYGTMSQPGGSQEAMSQGRHASRA